LDEMRMALEEMQARISAVSDSEALERRIQSLTSQSISAIEENLGQQMRQPLREEVADLLQQERRRWESELQQRLDSLEVQVRQTSSQVDESLKNARQDIGQINQRFQEFVDERGSARPILDEPQPNRAQASPSDIPYALPSQSEEEGDNAASMYDSDSEERELSPYDSQDFQGEQQDSESYTSESEESESEESDEVLEFQVDDESIRLRLNRMLGEHVERRPPAEAPKAVGSVINVYNSIAVADAAKGISPPTDESSALSGRYLLELNHIQDPVGDAQDSSPRANGSSAKAGTRGSVVPTRKSKPSTGSSSARAGPAGSPYR